MEKLVIAGAALEELDAVFDIYARTIPILQGRGIRQWDDEYPAREEVLGDIRAGTLFTVRRGGELVAAFTLDDLPDMLFHAAGWRVPEAPFLAVHRLCVVPGLENAGLGSEIMLRIEDMARERGVLTMRLDVSCENRAALRLYEKLGYVRVSGAAGDDQYGEFWFLEKELS